MSCHLHTHIVGSYRVRRGERPTTALVNARDVAGEGDDGEHDQGHDDGERS